MLRTTAIDSTLPMIAHNELLYFCDFVRSKIRYISETCRAKRVGRRGSDGGSGFGRCGAIPPASVTGEGSRSRGAKCKKRIAHKVTSWGYARQIPIGRPVLSKNRDWSKVVGRLTYPQSNVTSHANSRGGNLRRVLTLPHDSAFGGCAVTSRIPQAHRGKNPVETRERGRGGSGTLLGVHLIAKRLTAA